MRFDPIHHDDGIPTSFVAFCGRDDGWWSGGRGFAQTSGLFSSNCQKTFKHRLLFSFDLIGGYLNKLGHFVPQ